MRHSYILLSAMLLAGLTLFAGCYSDDSNDNLSEPLRIEVSGIEPAYTVAPGGDRLKIHPVGSPADRQYDCFWTVTPSTATWGEVPDTIARTEILDVPVNLDLGSYKLRFCAKDRQTGIFSYTEYNLNVTTDMNEGWWVLKSEGDSTDFDFFTDKKQKRDLILAANGHHLAGTAVNLAQTDSYWDFDEGSKTDKRCSAVFVASKNDLAAIDFFTGRIIRGFNDLFMDVPKREVRDLFTGPSDIHVYVDGHVYTLYNSKYSVYKQFVIKVLGDYDLSPWHHCAQSLPLLYNRSNDSFCSVSRTSSGIDYFPNASPSSNKTGMDLVFLGGMTTSTYTQGDVALAVMHDRKTGKHYLYTLNGQPYSMGSNPITGTAEMPDGLGLYTADYSALNQNSRIIYYSKSNRIYACNLDSWTETLQDVQPAAGETVTYMEYLKYAPYGMNSSWFDYLAVATSTADGYKLYLHPVKAGKVMPAERVLSGKGKVRRACFMSYGSYGTNMTTLF